jgi:DNA-binding GntR family transcriptional regulator
MVANARKLHRGSAESRRARTASGRADETRTLRAGADGDRLADSVYERVKADILEFRLVPGARFSESEIAERARVSRTPVREALYRLAREGYLLVHAKSGWSVQPFDFERFDHLYDVRVVLELAAVRKLCSGEHGDRIARLRDVWLAPASERPTDGFEVARLDEAFHSTLVAAVGNPELARLHAEVTERIRIIRRLDFTQAERVACTYQEHGAILLALLARKAAHAEFLLKSHIEQSKLEVRKITLHRLHLAHTGARGAARSA